MKKTTLLILAVLFCSLFQGCRKEEIKEQTLEEYVLERLHKDFGAFLDFTPKEVIKAYRFENAELKVTDIRTENSPPRYKYLYEINDLWTYQWGVFMPSDISEPINGTYLVTGYGIEIGDIPGIIRGHDTGGPHRRIIIDSIVEKQ